MQYPSDGRRIRQMAGTLHQAVAPQSIDDTDALIVAEILLRYLHEGRNPTPEEFVAILRSQNHPSYKIRDLTYLLFD